VLVRAGWFKGFEGAGLVGMGVVGLASRLFPEEMIVSINKYLFLMAVIIFSAIAFVGIAYLILPVSSQGVIAVSTPSEADRKYEDYARKKPVRWRRILLFFPVIFFSVYCFIFGKYISWILSLFVAGGISIDRSLTQSQKNLLALLFFISVMFVII